MKLKIYLDLVLLINFAMDYSLLRAAAGITGSVYRSLRLTLSAALGALYGAAALLPGFGFLGSNLWRTVFLLLMSAAAFGTGAGFARRTGVLFLLSLALGGAAQLIRAGSVPTLLLLALGLYAAGRFFLRGGMTHAGQLVPAEITLGGKSLHLNALRDSGNTLCDPFTGQPVLLVQGSEVQGILGKLDLADAAGALERLRTLRPELKTRLIPYKSVGGNGLLLAVKCDRITVNGRPQSLYAAFSPDKLSGNGEYTALTGGGNYV